MLKITNLRKAAESISWGLFVAPISVIFSWSEVPTPSNWRRNSVFNLLLASCSFSLLEVRIESISSIKMTYLRLLVLIAKI